MGGIQLCNLELLYKKFKNVKNYVIMISKPCIMLWKGFMQ